MLISWVKEKKAKGLPHFLRHCALLFNISHGNPFLKFDLEWPVPDIPNPADEASAPKWSCNELPKPLLEIPSLLSSTGKFRESGLVDLASHGLQL